jgi:hypothetical protein
MSVLSRTENKMPICYDIMTMILLTMMIIFIFSGCSKTGDENVYRPCDADLFKACDGKGVGDFCTFGLKWGSGNPFSNGGLNKPGPATGDIVLVYQFIDAGLTFNTHSQDDVKSLPFDANTPACTKEKFREAFREWSANIKVDFQEAGLGERADIRIVIADIPQSSLGYPRYVNSPCTDLNGLIVFKKNEYSCPSIYGAILHEIGHVLGLGHVVSNNVMHPSQSTRYSSLQPGDIRGGQTIYGAR